MVNRPSWTISHASVRVSDRFESGSRTPSLRHDVTPRQPCQMRACVARPAERPTGPDPRRPRRAAVAEWTQRNPVWYALVRARPSGGGQSRMAPMFWKPDVDVYSWNPFIAVNWPADTSTCQADTIQSIVSGPGSGVWETWALPRFRRPSFHPAHSPPRGVVRVLPSPGPSVPGATSSQLIERFLDLNEAFGAGPWRTRPAA